MKPKVLVLFVLLLLCQSAQAVTYQVWIDPAAKTQGWRKVEFQDHVKAGLRLYGAVANVRFKFVDDPAQADVSVVTEVLIESGVDVKEQYRGDNVLRLHSGKNQQIFTAAADIQRNTAHVFGHFLGFAHSDDLYCIMHSPNPGPYFCQEEQEKLVRMFGPSKKHDEP